MRNLFFAFVLISLVGLAQKQASQWHFGAARHINFLNNPPIPSNNSAIWGAIEGCASIADDAGNLQFYTNGGFVWDKNHNQMPGFLGGNPSSVQSSVIVKKSGTQYYIFTTGAFGTGSFGYSIVDMALAGGAGSITTSYTLLDSVSEKMSATLHCNGSSTWVMVHKMGNDAFCAYLASPAGVNSIPIISNIGRLYTDTNSAIGSMKFSPNGSKLAVASTPFTYSAFSFTIPKTVELYDFDKATGVLSNSVAVGTYTSMAFGVEFSPDGSKLYCQKRNSDSASLATDVRYILQWDLCAGSGTAIAASVSTVAALTNGPQGLVTLRLLQNAINGKIYFNATPSTWGCINSPNATGTLCNVTANNVITFTNTPALTGTPPNFLTNYFRQKSSFVNTTANASACGNVTFTPSQVCAGSGNTVNGYKWLFGDPSSGSANTSTLTNASHVYSANGTYTVGLIAYYPCNTDTTFQTVSISGLPSLTVSGKSTICVGEKTTFTLSGSANYVWNGTSISNTHSVSPTSTTVYTITAYDVTTCQVLKTITLTVLPCVSINEFTNDIRCKIYPNPTDGVFTVDLFESSKVKISDVSGKEVYSLSLPTGTTEINLNHCSKGIYFVELKGKGFTKNVKLVKE